MTRTEFVNEITLWDELIELCASMECPLCEDIVSDDNRDSEIEEDIVDLLENNYWHNILDMLNAIPTGSDYYQREETLVYRTVDEYDFEEYKNSVMEWMDENGIFDEEEHRASNDIDVFAKQRSAAGMDTFSECVQDEDFSISALIGMCSEAFAAIKENSRVDCVA